MTARTYDGTGRGSLLRKNTVKLLLNLSLIAASAIPRGGAVVVEFDVDGETARLKVEAKGTNARLPHAAAVILTGGEVEIIDGYSIQPYYTALLAKDCGMTVRTAASPESIVLTAGPESLEGPVAQAGTVDSEFRSDNNSRQGVGGFAT